MRVARRINLLVICGVLTLGTISTDVSVLALKRSGKKEVESIRAQMLAAKQEKLKDLVRNAHRAVEEVYTNAHDPARVADTYRPLLKGAVDVAYTAIQTVYDDPAIPAEEKQARATSVVKGLRYGPEGKDYFWINDTRPYMVMHPYKSSLDGTDLSGFKDPNGKPLFNEFVKVCKDGGDGFVDYLWPRYGAEQPVPKLSYVRLFEPWGWIVGSGVYLESAEAKAKQDAMKLAASFRYGPEGRDYFWINDAHPTMVMHPYKPELDGKDLSNFKDPNGKHLFKEFVRECEANGEGFVDYFWPKPGKDEPVAKLSFVKLFEPWGWILGTGIYIDDVDDAVAVKEAAIAADVTREIWRQALVGGSITLALALLAGFYTRHSFRPIQRVTEALRDMAEGEGDLTKRLPVAYVDCAAETQCGQAECGCYGKREPCWTKVGSMQMDKTRVQCPIVRSGKITGCTACTVFKKAETDEFAILSNWFNIFADKLLHLVSTVKDSTVVSAGFAQQLSAATHQIAENNSQVSNQSQSVASATEEMNATVAEVASRTAVVSDAAEESRQAATSGARVIEQVAAALQEIESVVTQAGQTVQVLGDRSKEIGDIVAMIEEITDQTNLLALNAAIEAARAGDAGRGFAVVADEVRKLAEKTVKATQEIARTAQAIQTEASTAVGAMENGAKVVERGRSLGVQAGEAMASIQDRVVNAADQTQQIATATEQLKATVEDVTGSMEHIAGEMTQNSDATNGAAATAQSLAAKAEEIQTMLGRFRT